MIVIIPALIGILLGAFTAKRRGGKTADILQYAVGYGIAFALVGVILTITLDKMLAGPVY